MKKDPPPSGGLLHNELFAEMGLGPQWRLRTTAAMTERREDARDTPAGAVSRPDQPAEPVQPQPGERREQRIARMDWAALAQETADCQACGLCRQRQQAVLGVGDTAADWLFIGEGPGAEEDARGEPFVGQAGKLLDAMLRAIGLRRGDDVYIANAVKCRPPNNRTPEVDEIAACKPYLLRQIELLQPRLIVLLGRVAVQALLGESGTLAALRGQTFSHRTARGEIPMLVSYHPAYLLRNLPDKAKAWQDLCRARQLMRQAKSAAADGPIAAADTA